MSQHSTGNYVYYLDDGKQNKSKQEKTLSDDKLQKILETLSKQAMKEKTPEFQELESLLQNSIKQNENEDPQTDSDSDEQLEDGEASLTKLLKEKGYLRDKKNG